ncbi:MAG: hypothetical protein ACRDRX_13115 [Pseudonocardiaceae bacterium]
MAQQKEPQKWLVIAAILLAGSSVGAEANIPFWADAVLRGLLLSGAIVVLVKLVRPWHKRRLKERPLPQFPHTPVPPENVFWLKRRAGSSLFAMDKAALKIFALAVAKPTEVRQRVVDTYVPERRTVHQRVSIECQIPKDYLLEHEHLVTGEKQRGSPPVIYFPLLMPRKGKLQDEFNVFNGDGSAVSVLAYREYLQLVACTVRALLLASFGKERYSELPKEVRDAERNCLLEIMKRRDPGARVPSLQPESDLDRLSTANLSDVVDGATFEIVRSFVRKLTNNYGIVAIVRPESNGRFLVKYEQILIPNMKLSKPASGLPGKSVGWLRVALGARPVDLTIGIENACTCQSYHLRVAGTDGLYLMRQVPLDYAKTIATTARGAPTLPHLRFRRRLGQPHGHFYARYFPESQGDEQPRIRFKFGEIPPGSLLRAAIAAAASLVLVWLVGVVNSDWADPGTDAPAFLLAFPAIAATWLGFESLSRRLLEGTLRARFSLMVTAGQSIAATGLFMAHKAYGQSLNWWKLPANMHVFWVQDLSWLAILRSRNGTTYPLKLTSSQVRGSQKCLTG